MERRKLVEEDEYVERNCDVVDAGACQDVVGEVESLL